MPSEAAMPSETNAIPCRDRQPGRRANRDHGGARANADNTQSSYKSDPRIRKQCEATSNPHVTAYAASLHANRLCSGSGRARCLYRPRSTSSLLLCLTELLHICTAPLSHEDDGRLGNLRHHHDAIGAAQLRDGARCFAVSGHDVAHTAAAAAA